MKSIVFNTEMVRAILDGRKTQVREIIKPQPSNQNYALWRIASSTNKKIVDKYYWADVNQSEIWLRDDVYFKPKYQADEIIYVREAFQIIPPNMVFYKADTENKEKTGWKPSIYMPEKIARIFLKVTNVRVQQLQDITEEEAIAEGSNILTSSLALINPIIGFQDIWAEKYGVNSWDKNPYVWVYAIEIVETKQEY